MAECPACHRTVPDGRPRCLICGAMLVVLPKCPQCNHPNPPQLRTCQRCGAAMGGAAAADDGRVTCAQCQRKIAPNSPACTYCGARMPAPDARALPPLKQQLEEAFRKLRPPQELLGLFDRILALDPRDPGLWQRKGLLLDLLGRPEDALACFDKLIALAPTLAVGHFGQGSALKQLGRLADSADAYGRGLVLAPDDTEALVNRAHVLSRLQRFAEALASAERAVRLDPAHAEGWFRLGVAANGLGERERAALALRKFLSLRPEAKLPDESNVAQRLLARLPAGAGSPADLASRTEPTVPGRASVPASPAAPAAPTIPAALADALSRACSLCVPGPWPDVAAMAEALDRDPEYRYEAPFLIHRASGRRFSVPVTGRCRDLARDFRKASGGRLEPAVYEAIEKHAFVPVLVGLAGSQDDLQAVMEAGCAFLRAGAHAIKVESSGFAHSAEEWRRSSEGNTPVDRLDALVTTIASAKTGRVRSRGMHQFGLAEAAVEDPTLGAEGGILIVRAFCFGMLGAPKPFQEGDRHADYRLHLRRDPPPAVPDPQYNPWGTWELVRGDESPAREVPGHLLDEPDLARTLLARITSEIGQVGSPLIAAAAGIPSPPGTRLILCVPGPWTDAAAMAQALDRDPEYRFEPPHLIHHASGRRCTVERYDRLDDLTRAFRYASQGRFEPETYEAIAMHAFVPYLVGPCGSQEHAQAMLDAGCAFVRAGAHAVKVETAGIAHAPTEWQEFARANDARSQFRALVVTLVDPDTGKAQTCGMHAFGLAEASCDDPTLNHEERVRLAHLFCLYALLESPRLEEGHTFHTEEDSPRYRLRLRRDSPAGDDDLHHNPWGTWELVRAE